MKKLIMKVGDVIKAKNKPVYGIVGAEIGQVDTDVIKNIILKKGSLSRTLTITEVQTSASLIGKRNLFLITSTPVEAKEIEGADVFAEFA